MIKLLREGRKEDSSWKFFLLRLHFKCWRLMWCKYRFAQVPRVGISFLPFQSDVQHYFTKFIYLMDFFPPLSYRFIVKFSHPWVVFKAKNPRYLAAYRLIDFLYPYLTVLFIQILLKAFFNSQDLTSSQIHDNCCRFKFC